MPIIGKINQAILLSIFEFLTSEQFAVRVKSDIQNVACLDIMGRLEGTPAIMISLYISNADLHCVCIDGEDSRVVSHLVPLSDPDYKEDLLSIVEKYAERTTVEDR